MIIGKQFRFCAAHFIPGHPKCGEIHGHDYTVTIELSGDVNEQTGMVMDFGKLSSEMYIIIGKLDHSFLNKIISIPTCENLCFHFCEILKSIELESQLDSITIQEGFGGYAKLIFKKDANGVRG